MVKNIKILVIDDDKGIRQILQQFLEEQCGYFVDLANDGASGLELFKNGKYDLSIVDIRMPGMDGIEFLGKVKIFDPNAIVIMMTGVPNGDSMLETMFNDGYTYIAKPLSFKRLKNVIEKAIETRKQNLAK
ncbi:response regulator [bacterium]|nr:response regulator [bacterium]